MYHNICKLASSSDDNQVETKPSLPILIPYKNFSNRCISNSTSPYSPNNYQKRLNFTGNSNYNPMIYAKGSGIIPYTINNGIIYFLLQHATYPCNKKYVGWNDFGGKRNYESESTFDIASREFSEETSCLFYLKENKIDELYGKLKYNDLNEYDKDTITELINIIPLSQEYYSNKIKESNNKLFLSSNDSYISYLVNVEYISASDIPKSEDLHIPYIDRYTRTCKWFTFEELMGFDETNFHKRLQITKIKQRIKFYYDKKMF